MPHEFSYWRSCGPTALSGGLVAGIAALTFRSFVLSWNWGQGVVGMVLLGVAAGLLIAGWPRRTRLLVLENEILDGDSRRSILRDLSHLSFDACGDDDAAGAEIRFQLIAVNQAGDRQILQSDGDPGRIWHSARRLSRETGIGIESRVQTRGAMLPDEFVKSRHRLLPIEPRWTTLRPRNFFSFWLALAGCAFVAVVCGALLRAHWARGTLATPQSLLLLGALCVIAAMFPRWGLRIQLQHNSQTPSVGAVPNAETARSIGGSPLGPQVWQSEAAMDEACWVIEAWQGGPEFLVRDGETSHRTKRLR